MVFSVQPRMITDTGQHAAGTIKSMMHTAAHCSNHCTSWLCSKLHSHVSSQCHW